MVPFIGKIETRRLRLIFCLSRNIPLVQARCYPLNTRFQNPFSFAIWHGSLRIFVGAFLTSLNNSHLETWQFSYISNDERFSEAENWNVTGSQKQISLLVSKTSLRSHKVPQSLSQYSSVPTQLSIMVYSVSNFWHWIN